MLGKCTQRRALVLRKLLVLEETYSTPGACAAYTAGAGATQLTAGAVLRTRMAVVLRRSQSLLGTSAPRLVRVLRALKSAPEACLSPVKKLNGALRFDRGHRNAGNCGTARPRHRRQTRNAFPASDAEKQDPLQSAAGGVLTLPIHASKMHFLQEGELILAKAREPQETGEVHERLEPAVRALDFCRDPRRPHITVNHGISCTEVGHKLCGRMSSAGASAKS